MKKATLFFAVFAVLAGCSDDDPKQAIPEDGPNPIVPEVDPYPFPSDYYLVPDDSTATGRRRREGPHCSIRESGAAGSAGVSRPRWRTCGSLQSPSTSNSVTSQRPPLTRRMRT